MKTKWLLLLGLSIAGYGVPGAADRSLEEKVKSVLPAPEEERWLTIPWRTDLMQARAEAQRSGRPLFLWIMDGHPLACV